MANATVILPLSASVQGKAITVVAVATPGTLIHSTSINATDVDRITIDAYNSDSVERVLSLEFGGAVLPIMVAIPARSGRVNIMQGNVLLGSGAAALDVRAFASAASVITILGFVFRVTP